MNTNLSPTETSATDRWWLLWMLTTLVLCWPALWNGHPLFFYDSMDYTRSAFTLTPAHYRTLPYSLFLAGPEQMGTLWAVVLSQATIGAYVRGSVWSTRRPSDSPWCWG